MQMPNLEVGRDSEARERNEYNHISLFAKKMHSPSFHGALRDKSAQRRLAR